MEIVSPVINIICRLWNCCSPHVTSLCNLKRDLISLTTSLDKLKSKRNDVMRRIDLAESDPSEPKERTDEVMHWLRRVEAIEQGVNEILQQINDIQVSKSSCCCRRRSNNCWTDYKLAKLVIENLSSLKELMSEGEFSVVAERYHPRQIQEMPATMVVGMEAKLEELWRFVIEDNQVRIMGIYGMGGIGKTTLLKKLNNEFLKRKSDFDTVIWAVVSKDFNIEKVQKQIADSVGLTLPGEPDLNRTSRNILRVLSKKKFVLLLDDVWQRIDLLSIGVPSLNSNTQETKSMVIFTTRSKVVCGLMEAKENIRVDCLDWNEAWTLFQDKVGHDVIYSKPQIPTLAEVVAEECRGLPLALNTIGRTMASKKTIHEWRHAINVLQKSASDFPGMDDEVLSILKFSYDNLRSDKIKSCFLYCSLFPEDHSINPEELIDYWIAEGFINDFENIDEARDQGHDIIGYLKSVCLLENYSSLKSEGLQMHDVIRDLAIWIVTDYGENKGKYLVDNGFEPKPDEWEKAERVFVLNEHYYRLNLSTNCSNLSTLIFTERNNTICRIGDQPFQNMSNLKVLSLNNKDSIPKELVASICQLYELRYLHLESPNKNVIPNELKKMVKLMFLSLKGYSFKIRSGVIPGLMQLRVLDLYESGIDDWEMEGGPSIMEFENLKYLNDLGIQISSFLALQKLVSIYKFQIIITRLRIENCKDITSLRLTESSSSSSSSSFSIVANFKNLRTLHLLDCIKLEELRISPSGMQMLEHLSLVRLPNLEIVWDNKVLPSQEELCLLNLQDVYIFGCHKIKNLTWLVYAQDLVTIKLEHMFRIEEIISDGFPVGEHAKLKIFPNLQSLWLFSLVHLKSICSRKLDSSVLENIYVQRCPGLEKLSLDNDIAKNITLSSPYEFQNGVWYRGMHKESQSQWNKGLPKRGNHKPKGVNEFTIPSLLESSIK